MPSRLARAALALAMVAAIPVQAGAVGNPALIREAIEKAPYMLRLAVVETARMPAEGTRAECAVKVRAVAMLRAPAGERAPDGPFEVVVPCFTPGAAVPSCAFSIPPEGLVAGRVFEGAFVQRAGAGLAMVPFSYRAGG